MRISDWSSDVCSSDLAGAGVHVQRDLALEHQVAFHHRIGSDHDARLAVAAELDRQPGRVLLVDLQPAAYVRVDADGDVAVDGLDAAAQLGGDGADRAVDRFDALGDVAAAADEDAAVDRLDAAADARPPADADVAVDGAQVLGLDVVAGLAAAVDGLCVPGVRAVLPADAAVAGVQVAVHLAGLGGDPAVHLFDIGE